jgi:hypothetical protein
VTAGVGSSAALGTLLIGVLQDPARFNLLYAATGMPAERSRWRVCGTNPVNLVRNDDIRDRHTLRDFRPDHRAIVLALTLGGCPACLCKQLEATEAQ